MREDDEDEYRERYRTAAASVKDGLRLPIARALFDSLVLHGFAIGPAFRNFVIPDEHRFFNSSSFESVYCGNVPESVSDRADRILIEWITKQVPADVSVLRMEAVIADLESLEIPEERQLMTDACLSSLRSLAKYALPSQDCRDLAAAIVHHFRSAFIPGTLPSSGDKPIGRG